MNAPVDVKAWLLANGFRATPLSGLSSDGQYALITAAQQGRCDVLDYVLQQRENPNVVDIFGNNALWAACFAESAECIATLLDAGVDIDFQNSAGATALAYASSSGKQAVVAQLLQAGADPLLTTHDDFSALDLASNRECLKLLRQALKDLV
ncbi:MAG: ankyrin repeat domain-containing protein [Gammaproteobacteria bacterium]